MASNLLTLAILAVPALYLYLNGRILSPGGYVTFLYAISVLSALFARHYTEWYSLEASAFLGLVLVVFFMPLLVHAKSCGRPIRIGNAHMLLPLAKALAVLGALSLVKFVTVAGSIAENILTPTGYRTDKIFDQAASSVSMFDYAALIGTNLYTLFLALYFVLVIKHPEKRTLQGWLFLSSLTYPLITLAVDMSRGGLIMWCLMSGLIYATFYPYLPSAKRRSFNIRISLLSAILLSLFALLTLGRGAVSGNVSMYLVDYFSHQFGNFNRFYAVVSNQSNDFSYVFPIFGYDRPTLVDEATDLLSMYGFSLNVFATFVGSLILHFHPTIVAAMAITFAIICSGFVLMAPRGLGTLFFVFAISEVFVWGLFYYNHGWRMSNLVLLGYCALALYFNPQANRKVTTIEPFGASEETKHAQQHRGETPGT